MTKHTLEGWPKKALIAEVKRLRSIVCNYMDHPCPSSYMNNPSPRPRVPMSGGGDRVAFERQKGRGSGSRGARLA